MLKNLIYLIILISLFHFWFPGSGQPSPKRRVTVYTEKCAKSNPDNLKSQNVRIVFYNTENLYDPYDDTTKQDEDFTFKGKKRWTYSRFFVKLTHFAKIMLAIGEGDLPAIIGLCEIENRYVMNRIIFDSPLKKFRYRFIHYDSPDVRGIDVALLYRPEKLSVISSRAIRIRFPFDTSLRTRDILYVRGMLFGADTLHILSITGLQSLVV